MAKKKVEEEPDEEEEGGGGKKKIIMIVGGLAALGAVYNFVLKAPPPEEDMAMTETTETTAVEGEIVTMDEMILNVGAGESAGYLRIGVAIVLEEGIVAKDFEAELPIAQDVAVQFLSAQTPERLSSPAGREDAKNELSALVREAYGDEKVIRVLFTSLVMQ